MARLQKGKLAPSGQAVAAALATLILAGCATTPSAPPIARAVGVAARRGNPVAQFDWGIQLLSRAHGPGQRAAGVEWIGRAARANLAVAQVRLGSMYLTGRGVPQNTARALIWLHRAARRGAPAAQLTLGWLYAVGGLVPVDKRRAYFWYSVAAKPVRSDVTIFNIWSVRMRARSRASVLAESLTPAQRAAVERRVAAWRPIPSVPYSGFLPLNGRRR